MAEKRESKRSSVLWLLVLALVCVAWWFFRPAPDEQASRLPPEIAALGDPDDILIDLKDSATDAQVAALERDLGLDLVLVSDESRDEQFYRAHVPAAKRDAILAELSGRGLVEIAEPDALYAASPVGAIEVTAPEAMDVGFPNDPLYGRQWHLKQIGMPEAWKLADGNGTIVAVLDTGVAYENHARFHMVEDLAGVEMVKPYDFVGNSKHANDDHGHGTHVAGTIAQATHNGIGVAGVARNVKIMPLKVLAGNGSGSVAGIADAIRYAADNGAKVINMSLGGAFPSRILKKAVEYAHKKGVTVVCAAGNEGRSSVGYPAAYPGAIAVSATQEDEATTFYSNYGKDVDIAAPGGNTRGGEAGGVLQNTIVVGNPTKSGYFAFMGTSMASPHAAGVAALVVGEGVTDPVQVEKILKETARKPKDKKYSSDRYGAGIIDAPAAIRAAQKAAKANATHDARATDPGAPWQLAAFGLLGAGGLAVLVRRKAGLGLYLAGAVVGTGGMWLLAGVLGGNPLAMSALAPLALVSLGAGTRLRASFAGVAGAVAGSLATLAVLGTDLRWIPGTTLDAVWMFANAGVSAALAALTLRR